jgi:hypothetical protein
VRRQRLIVGLAIAAMALAIFGTFIVSGLRNGGGAATGVGASYCATAVAEQAREGMATPYVGPGQGSYGAQVPADCRG